jgi:hypothetical protein
MHARRSSSALTSLTLVCLLSGCAREVALGERPGLGTAWGETRRSEVQAVDFERDEPGRPAAVATLHYDDHDGVRALVAAGAGGWPPGPSASGGVAVMEGAVRVRLLGARGWPLPHVQQGDRGFVEGTRGERYTIEIANLGDARLEAVATVDGRDVMDGGRGSLDKRGYVVGPRATITIDGFRRSMDDVAAFRFGEVADSYAARTGDDASVGVIAVALFAERGWRTVDRGRAREAERRLRADPYPGRFAAPPP